MICQLQNHQTGDVTPVYVHVTDAAPLPKSLHEALQRSHRIFSVAEIESMYPDQLLRRINADEPRIYGSHATLPTFASLSPDEQRLAIQVVAGEAGAEGVSPLLAWPNVAQSRVTLFDLVSQSLPAAPIADDLLADHASWLRAVQDGGFPSEHRLYDRLDIAGDTIEAAIANWPNVPRDARNFLRWNDNSLFSNISRHRVAVHDAPAETQAISGLLAQHGVQSSENPEQCTAHVATADPNAFIAAANCARQREQPCYIVSLPDDDATREVARLESAASVLAQLRDRFEDEPVVHSIADVQALLNAVIPHYPPTTLEQRTLF